MKIENEFTVRVPIDEAWKVLTDLEGIAPCLPGAQLTGVDGDVYRGKVRIKVGPVISEFAGTAQFAEKDDHAYRAVIDAKGRDSRSAGNAAALITATLRPAGESTVVSVDTDLKISGKFAQFGSGMIKEVSQKLLGQFVASLEAKIADKPPRSAEADPAPAGSEVNLPPEPPEPGQAEPGQAEPGQAEPGQAEPGQAEPGQAEPDPQQAKTTVSETGPTTYIAGSENATPKISPAASRPWAAVDDQAEPLDLLEIAGNSIRKRLIPVAVGAAVVVAAILLWRRVAR
jgi:carbon monoxide dehydrogenase subunit G